MINNKILTAFDFAVKVTPCAKKISFEIIFDMLGFKHIHIKVSQPPEDNKANKAVIEALSEYFDIAKSKISIKSGHTNSNKIINITADYDNIERCKKLIFGDVKI